MGSPRQGNRPRREPRPGEVFCGNCGRKISEARAAKGYRIKINEPAPGELGVTEIKCYACNAMNNIAVVAA